jgi:hypothetical protein
MTIENVIHELRNFSPDEIRQRLIALETEDKALRTLLRIRLAAERKTRPNVQREAAK